MTQLETNIYSIANLGDLSARYRLAEVPGLRPDQAEYFQNRQTLERRLSYLLKKPVLVVERDGIPFVVVPDDVAMLPAEVELVRVVVQLRLRDERFDLDYSKRGPDDLIALRFLRFLIQAPLGRDARLWQPQSGRPFFERTPARSERGIHRYAGFRVRPVVTPDSGVGLCVDVQHCYVSAQPLPAAITRNEFAAHWKGRNCIYHFAQNWYEIRLHALADRNVQEYRFHTKGHTWSLLDYILDHARRPLPADLGTLPADSAAVLYRNNRGTELAAAAALCYPVFRTNSDEVARQHGRTILPPRERRNQTRILVDRYLRALRFGDTQLCIAADPLRTPRRGFELPDLAFGNDTVLSARGTSGAVRARREDFGRRRLELLRDRAAGFHESAPLDRQYVILPRSIHDTLGARFIEDLSGVVNEFFPQPGGYKPIILAYDDRGQRTFAAQARALRDAAEAGCSRPGYALVMVHRTRERQNLDEDQLAAMVVRELRQQHDIRAAVIHSDVPRRAYRQAQAPDGHVIYRPVPASQRRLAGYLRNVVIAKLLLTNQRWPFVLATPLHAAVTVGVDVKNNSAGLLVVGSHGGDIRSEVRKSRQKERLLAAQMSTYLVDILRDQAQACRLPLSSLVIQRDGRAWPSELEGIRRAIRQLRSEGCLAPEARYAVLEIPKSSPVPLRLYNVLPGRRGQLSVNNPSVGTAYRAGDREAYLCSTGDPFLRQGTAHPLHVVMADGTLSFSEALEDLYSLTALTWTQPEGCARYPITIKLNDRILADAATEYDEDAVEFADPGEAGSGTGEEVA